MKFDINKYRGSASPLKTDFKRQEKIAGFFVIFALIGFLGGIFIGALKGHWLESRLDYYTDLEDSDGIRIGTSVESGGIKIGMVEGLEFSEKGAVRLHVSILKRYKKRVRRDSRIQLIRPFVVGDKVLLLTPGSKEAGILPEGSFLESEEIFGLTDLLNGKKLVPYMNTLTAAFQGFKEVVDYMVKEKGTGNIIKSFSGLPGLLKQANAMALEMTKMGRQLNEGEHLRNIVVNMSHAADELNKIIPELGEHGGANMAKNLALIVDNMAVLTTEFKKITPAIAEIAPDLPASSRRMIEALNEAVVVLKAMQKSWVLSGSAREVREEEAKEKEKKRLPASEATPSPSPTPAAVPAF